MTKAFFLATCRLIQSVGARRRKNRCRPANVGRAQRMAACKSFCGRGKNRDENISCRSVAFQRHISSVRNLRTARCTQRTNNLREIFRKRVQIGMTLSVSVGISTFRLRLPECGNSTGKPCRFKRTTYCATHPLCKMLAARPPHAYGVLEVRFTDATSVRSRCLRHLRPLPGTWRQAALTPRIRRSDTRLD